MPYRSTPVSSRAIRKNLTLNDSCNVIPNSNGQFQKIVNRTSCSNSRYNDSCNHSSSNASIPTNELGTPKSKQQNTPSSVRFRSRITKATCSTSHYTSPKKKLNFVG